MLKLVKLLLSFLPTPLPVGRDEFEKWADSVIELSGQFADRDSMIFAMSSMIVHLPPNKGFMPKREFVRCLRKAAANQVASAVFVEIRERNKPAEDPAAPKAPQDEQQAVEQKS